MGSGEDLHDDGIRECTCLWIREDDVLVRGGMRMDEVENNGLVRGRITFRRTGLALGYLEKLPELADYIALREATKRE